MIRIWLDNKVGGHENLHVDLPKINYSKIADTYYFALDNLFMPDDESKEKAVLNIKQLLNYWCDAIQRLKKDEVVFLPFDYSDEYIGCFRIKYLNNDEITVDYGYTTEYEGCMFRPSQFLSFKMNDENYNITTDSFQCEKYEFIKDINLSIKSLTK